MKLRNGGAIFALGMLASTSAHASDKEDFATCDGRIERHSFTQPFTLLLVHACMSAYTDAHTHTHEA